MVWSCSCTVTDLDPQTSKLAIFFKNACRFSIKTWNFGRPDHLPIFVDSFPNFAPIESICFSAQRCNPAAWPLWSNQFNSKMGRAHLQSAISQKHPKQKCDFLSGWMKKVALCSFICENGSARSSDRCLGKRGREEVKEVAWRGGACIPLWQRSRYHNTIHHHQNVNQLIILCVLSLFLSRSHCCTFERRVRFNLFPRRPKIHFFFQFSADLPFCGLKERWPFDLWLRRSTQEFDVCPSCSWHTFCSRVLAQEFEEQVPPGQFLQRYGRGFSAKICFLLRT